jgi:drug/metabolite transporter (DMT)-like permease
MPNLSGFSFALAGFALLTCGDAVIKSMAGLWPATAIAALRFSIAAPLLATIVVATQGASGLKPGQPWLQLGRGLSLAASSGFFFFSLFVLPLAEATAIVFVSPIITALLSAALLREPMGRYAWVATIAALIGVAQVLRPNLVETGSAAFLPIAAALFFALMMIFNRLVAGSGSAVAMQFMIVAVAAPIMILAATAAHYSGIAALKVEWPDPSVIVRCAIVAVTASLSHWLIFKGTTKSTAADAAQAVYIQLPVALVIDAAVFGKFPDAMALAGSLLIVGAGLTMWRNQGRMLPGSRSPSA